MRNGDLDALAGQARLREVARWLVLVLVHAKAH